MTSQAVFRELFGCVCVWYVVRGGVVCGCLFVLMCVVFALCLCFVGVYGLDCGDSLAERLRR